MNGAAKIRSSRRVIPARVNGSAGRHGRPEVRGKFIYAEGEKLYLRGATYGTFTPNSLGEDYPEQAVVERDARECPAHGGQRRLGFPRSVDETEIPVLDVEPAPVPLVRPAEREGAGAAVGEDRAELLLERPRLRRPAVSPAVEPDLGHDEGAVAGEVVEPREIRLEPLPRLEIHVEAEEVGERQVQVFGRRIVDVGDEPVRVLLLRRPVEPLEEALDGAAAVPAHDRGGDLVADRVAKDGGVAGARPDAPSPMAPRKPSSPISAWRIFRTFPEWTS